MEILQQALSDLVVFELNLNHTLGFINRDLQVAELDRLPGTQQTAELVNHVIAIIHSQVELVSLAGLVDYELLALELESMQSLQGLSGIFDGLVLDEGFEPDLALALLGRDDLN